MTPPARAKAPAAPEWLRARDVAARFGLPRHRLTALVLEGRVDARKTDPADPASATLYRAKSVRAAVESMPDYRAWLKGRRDGAAEGGAR